MTPAVPGQGLPFLSSHWWCVLARRLKTINLVIRSTQGAEELVRNYEDQLKDVQAVPSDLKALEATKAELKVTGLGDARGRGRHRPADVS